MILTVDSRNRALERIAMRVMFEARKQVFVDLLKWDIPVLAGRYEVDQFDNEHATYLILMDGARRHLASARLIPTDRPGILNGLFRDLCEGALPAGPDVVEITRFCLARGLRATERRRARDMLVSALAQHAMGKNIRTYTGVADMPWLEQILAFGWKCAPLGEPRQHDGKLLGALRIDIEPDTLDRLARNGIFAEPDRVDAVAQAA